MTVELRIFDENKGHVQKINLGTKIAIQKSPTKTARFCTGLAKTKTNGRRGGPIFTFFRRARCRGAVFQSFQGKKSFRKRKMDLLHTFPHFFVLVGAFFSTLVLDLSKS